MSGIVTVGLDLAKTVLQVHGTDDGAAGLRKKLRRDQVVAFFGMLAPCAVAMEACRGAHFWGREIGRLGRAARLIALVEDPSAQPAHAVATSRMQGAALTPLETEIGRLDAEIAHRAKESDVAGG